MGKYVKPVEAICHADIYTTVLFVIGQNLVQSKYVLFYLLFYTANHYMAIVKF